MPAELAHADQDDAHLRDQVEVAYLRELIPKLLRIGRVFGQQAAELRARGQRMTSEEANDFPSTLNLRAFLLKTQREVAALGGCGGLDIQSMLDTEEELSGILTRLMRSGGYS